MSNTIVDFQPKNPGTERVNVCERAEVVDAKRSLFVAVVVVDVVAVAVVVDVICVSFQCVRVCVQANSVDSTE